MFPSDDQRYDQPPVTRREISDAAHLATDMSFYRPIEDHSLSGKTLVVPFVAAANVAQLAADLFIFNLGLHRVGVFDSAYLVPVVGAREDGTPGITFPLELFANDTSPIAVIQQRSPVLTSCKALFTTALLDFIHTSNLAAVIFLGSVDMTNRTDVQMLTPTTYICPKSSPPLTSSLLASLATLPIPPYSSPVSQFPSGKDEATNTIVPFIPSGGLARRILSSLPDSWNTPCVCLLQFAMEGDNKQDAELLASVVARVLNQTIRSWEQPKSWAIGLFGAPPDQSLYG